MIKNKNKFLALLFILAAWLLFPFAGSWKQMRNEQVAHEFLGAFGDLAQQMPRNSVVYYYDAARRNELISYIRLELAPRLFYLDTTLRADTLLVALSPQLDTAALLQQRSILWQGTVRDVSFILAARKPDTHGPI